MFLGLVIIGLMLDQALKFYWLTRQPNLVVINQDVAFSLGNSYLFWLGLLLVLVSGVLFRWQPWSVWLGLGLAVLSNAVDRLVRTGVVDYLQVGQLHFNLADLMIVGLISYLGGLLLVKPRGRLVGPS